MAMSFLKDFLSVFRNKEEASTDHLEVYPEKVHVRALPDRRYLKESRFLVICCLISILFNFALCFIYIRNVGLVDRIIHNPNSLYTYLYSLDYYNKELRPVEKPSRRLDGTDVVVQMLITDFLTQRYEVVLSMEEMTRRWNAGGKMSAYLPEKKFEEFLEEAGERLRMLNRGITQKVFVYSVRSLNNGNFYEAVFDVFPLRENVYGAEVCTCYEQDEKCLDCLRRTTVGARRYKAYMRVSMDLTAAPDQQIVKTENPFEFKVNDYYLMEYRYAPGKGKKAANGKDLLRYNPWEDIDNRLE